jgi:hypothetical protein
MRLVVAWGVVPVLILPIGNLSVLAQGVGPVVPGFAARWNVGLAVLLVHERDEGQHEFVNISTA